MILEFTDTDYGVIMDALLITSEKIHAEGRATPNLDIVRQKLGAWASPAGCEFTVLTGDDATVLREANAAAMRARAARETPR